MPRQHPQTARSTSGITMIELIISILILTVAAYMLSSTITASLSHTVAKREQAVAVEAAMNKMEEMRAEEFIDLFRIYNANPNDDPLGAGTAVGEEFDVVGLDAIVAEGGAVLPVGRVIIPQMGNELREDQVDPDLGLPRDLNGDFLVDGLDHSEDYLVLPVIVRIEWSGRLGPRSFEMSTMFVDLRKEGDAL